MRPVGVSASGVLQRLERVEQSGVFSNGGPQVQELESRYASFFGVAEQRVIAVSSATSGLTASAIALGGTNWLAPSWTFSASVAALLAARKEVTFGDIRPDTQTLDLGPAEGFDSVLFVLPFGAGFSPELKALDRPLLIDAAASIGSERLDFDSLPRDSLAVFSLHATKVLGAGEGGLIIAGSDEKAEFVRGIINFGFDSERVSVTRGINAKLSEYSAAFCHTALDRWEEEREDWEQARALLVGLVGSISRNITLLGEDPINPYGLIKLREPGADDLSRHLRSVGIDSRKWWANGCHCMPAYRDLSRLALPKTDYISQRVLGIPFYRRISRTDVSRVAQALLEWPGAMS